MHGQLFARQGGSGDRLLVLLHGIAGTAEVWNGLVPAIERDWKGRWIAPDLSGHGRSPRRSTYGFATFAADVAELVGREADVTLVGHSMGGVVAMLLGAGWNGVEVSRVVAFSVKTTWPAEEVGKLHGLGRMPAKRFETRPEAIDRYLKVSGLAGLVPPGDEAASAGVVERGGGFELATDPAAYLAVGPEIEKVARTCAAPLSLFVGERDQMAPRSDALQLTDAPGHIGGVGHNPHVEAPEKLWAAIRPVIVGN